MGLNIFTFLWDFLKQSFLFLLGATLLFLVVAGASNSGFFGRYYAKDIGLTVETIHAVRGDVNLDYEKLLHNLDYNVTKEALTLRESGRKKWQVRKRYGATLDGANVEENLLLRPEALMLSREGLAIKLKEVGEAPPTCPIVDAPTKEATHLTIAGESPLRGRALATVERSFRARQDPELVITFTIEERLQPGIEVIVASSDNALGDAFTCNFVEALTPLDVESKGAGSAEEGHLDILFLHHTVPGLDEDKVASALTAALGEVLS